MTEHSHCSGYVYDRSNGGSLQRFGEYEWTATNLWAQEDLSVVDIECDGEVVAITTGKWLTVLDAETGEIRRSILHPQYRPGLEAFSRLTIAGGRVWVNRLIAWEDSVLSEVLGYSIEQRDDEDPESCTQVESLLTFQKMPVVNNHVQVQLQDGSVLAIALDDTSSCPATSAEGGPEGCGWRCLMPVTG